MQAGVAGYELATTIYVVAIGLLLNRKIPGRKDLAAIGITALVMGFGLHYAFTKVFVIDLP
jgi:hypothetical protein